MTAANTPAATAADRTSPAETRTLIDAAVQHLPKAEFLGLVPGPTGEENDGVMLHAVPKGMTLEHFDTEHLLFAPRRIRTHQVLADAASFCAYVERFTTDRTTLWAELCTAPQKFVFAAVLDDHALGSPSWRSHTARYAPVISEEWKRWLASDNKPLGQVDFALFLEQNMADIATVADAPTGSDILKMALQFEANQDLRLRSHVRLQSGGVAMEYVSTDDKETIERMQLFDGFAVGIPVFWADQRYEVRAKLRYRVRDGKAAFWYELRRPDLVYEHAAKAMINSINAELQGVPFFMGAVA